MRRSLFELARNILIATTGNGMNRSESVNNLHHKLSYRLHKKLSWFGIQGEVMLPMPGLPGKHITVESSDGGVAHQFLVYRTYEPYESLLLQQVLEEGMTVYNIGANIGYYAILSGSLVGKEGEVYAFEPSPKNFELLSRNLAQNGLQHVHAYQKAVSDRDGTLQLFFSASNSGDHQIFEAEAGRASVEVETVSLSSFMRTVEEAPDVMIMDVQGAEFAVLNGFKEYLLSQTRKPLVLFTEFSPSALIKAGSSPKEFLELIRAAGLSISVIDENNRTTTHMSDNELIETTLGTTEKNLLCR